MSNVKEVVGNELKQGFKNQAQLIEEGVLNAVSRSRAVTPAPHSGDSNVRSIRYSRFYTVPSYGFFA